MHVNMSHCANAEVAVSRGHVRQKDVFSANRNGLREFQTATPGKEPLAPGSRIDSDNLTGKPDIGDKQVAVLGYGDAQWVADSGAKAPTCGSDCLFSCQCVQANDGLAIGNQDVSSPVNGDAVGNTKRATGGDDSLRTGLGVDANDGQRASVGHNNVSVGVHDDAEWLYQSAAAGDDRALPGCGTDREDGAGGVGVKDVALFEGCGRDFCGRN